MVADSPFFCPGSHASKPDNFSQSPWCMVAFYQSPHWGTAHGNTSDFRYICAVALGNCVKGL